MAVVLIPAATEGITTGFWQSWVLAGAESDEVILPASTYRTPSSSTPRTARRWTRSRPAACLVRVADRRGLSRRRFGPGRAGDAAGRGRHRSGPCWRSSSNRRTRVEQVAAFASQPDTTTYWPARCTPVRRRAGLERASMAAAASAGGMAFIGSSDIAYLLAASRALAFHPPSLTGASEPLADISIGAALVL